MLSHEQDQVVTAFTQHPLLWLPEKKIDKPAFESVEVEGMFVRTSHVRLHDTACSMEAISWERQQLRIMDRCAHINVYLEV